MFRKTPSLLSTDFSMRKGRTIFALVFAFLLPQIIFSQDVTPTAPPTVNVQSLELGKPLERKISGGQKHTYKFALAERQFARVSVEQIGGDMVVRIVGADGKPLIKFDAEYRTGGTETMVYSATSAVDLTLEVESKLPAATEAAYKIALDEIRAATDDDFSLQEAAFSYYESARLGSDGKYKEAFAPAERALAIRERILGTNDERTALALSNLGILNDDLGDEEKAKTYFRKALSVYEKLNKTDTLNAADVINNLANHYQTSGEFAEAEKMYLRALEIREKELGSFSNRVASNLNNLGNFYHKRGDNARAQEMYERSVKIREQIFGKDSVDLTFTLNNLAYFYYTKGDYATALKINERVLAIREKKLPADHPYIGETLDSLGLIYADLGDAAKAETFYLRAVANREGKFGKESIKTAPTLSNLAKLYADGGDFIKAEILFERVLTIAEKSLNKDEIEYADYLKKIGDFYLMKSDYAKAERFLKRALEIRRKILGAEHFEVGRTCSSLARLYSSSNEPAQAILFQECANRIDEKNISLNLFIGTEQAKLSYIKLLAEDLNQTINLQIAQPENKAALEQTVTALLQRKGRGLDAAAANLSDLRRRFNADDQILLQKLNDVLAAVAELSLDKPKNISPEEYQKQIAALEDRKDKLEDEISRASQGFFNLPKAVTLAEIRAAIPADAALLEFSLYRAPDRITGGKTVKGEARYIVHIIRRQGEIGTATLGAASEIETAIDAYRQTLRDSNRRDYRAKAAAVYKKLFEPIEKFLGDSTRLLISPDGDLNLMPFEALVDGAGKYLVENYSLSYLTGGRDLLRMQTRRASKSDSLIIANPSFGAAATPVNNSVSNKKSITATRDLSGTYFAPLGGTIAEARVIQTEFPAAQLLTGAQANETALKQAVAPRILHIASHGFFLENTGELNGESSAQKRDAAFSSETENPMLRSGIALAGANERKNGAGDDGILTALEASGLNLWGTKLVVLSACDTGLGEIKNGEGVYGLRRAFVLAGTESLVMSLWSVSDAATRELMANYYKNLKAGIGRGESLRQVQLAMIKRKERAHPFYWAGFIQSGEWANLDGKR